MTGPAASTPDQVLVVRRSRRRAALGLGLTLVLAVLAVLFGLRASDWLERIFAVSLALFAVMIGILLLLSVLDTSPVLELGPDGLVDHGSPARAGRLRWDEIKRVEIVRIGRQPALAVQVYRPQRFLVDLPAERREAAEAVIQRHGTPIVIPWVGLDRDLSSVVAQAETLRQRAHTA